MPKKEKRKRRKHTASASASSLSDVCNVTGLNDGPANLDGLGIGGMGDDVMDCLSEMAASAQVAASGAPGSGGNAATDTAEPSTQTEKDPPKLSSPQPPGIHQIPNLRIELARHLQMQNLSTFLLKSCPGLRMPSFERWVLDSKLEEADRLQCIAEEWAENPSLRPSERPKKKYGRAAVHIANGGDSGREQDEARQEKDCDLLLAAERRLPVQMGRQRRRDRAGQWIQLVDRDPVLPYSANETDASCKRLLAELTAVMAANQSTEEDQEDDGTLPKSAEMVREMCSRAGEACKELHAMERRLGKHQKFGWDSGSKKRKRGGSGGAGNVDKIRVEWHGEKDAPARQESKVCSLVYTPKPKKRKRPKSTTGNPYRTKSTADDNKQEGDDSASQRKSKPFVVKVNGSHYRKLRSMFDATYHAAGTSLPTDQATHAFHAAVFALVIRYSSLSGGQMLNDFRGGGMQGAVHEDVFACLSKWLGGEGTECFASPFNATLKRFCSAFPSPDVDGHFGGSSGDFFRPPSEAEFLRPGWYELNPPFSPGLMGKMEHRIEELLAEAQRRELEVTFVVVIPTVLDGKPLIRGEVGEAIQSSKKKKKRQKHEDNPREASDASPLTATVHRAASQSFRQLIDNPHCKQHIVLPAREHGYIEGGQHLRPTRYKESQSATSVIVLSTKRWLTEDDETQFERGIRGAFASRHAEEVRQRKGKSRPALDTTSTD
ncbi:hypothetical protein ACHAXT_002168 [Thalassiosira profunda]